MRNKARLVTKRYNQEASIDFDKTFAPMAKLEAIRILLAFESRMGIKLFQMDIKCAFLNGFLNKEVYVEQPLGFENLEFPNHFLKAWYERHRKSLLENGFTRKS